MASAEIRKAMRFARSQLLYHTIAPSRAPKQHRQHRSHGGGCVFVARARLRQVKVSDARATAAVAAVDGRTGKLFSPHRRRRVVATRNKVLMTIL